jgi:hypothetical protein
MRTFKSITEKITASGPLWVKENAANGTNRVSFFSQLQGKKIVDREGNSVGKLTDLSLRDAAGDISHSLYLQHSG